MPPSLFSADEFRQETIYQEALGRASYLQYGCYDYVTQYEERRDSLTDNGNWIMRKWFLYNLCSVGYKDQTPHIHDLAQWD